MSTILFIISLIAICVAIVIKVDQDDAKKNEAKGNKTPSAKKNDAETKKTTVIQIIAIIIFVIAFFVSAAIAPDKPSSKSMSPQEQENARYAYEAGKWMDSNGYS